MFNKFALLVYLAGSLGASAHGKAVDVIPDDIASGVANTEVNGPTEPSHSFNHLLVSSSPDQDGESASFSQENDIFKLSFSKKLDLHINVINLFDRDNRLPSVLFFPEGVVDRSFSVNIGLRYKM